MDLFNSACSAQPLDWRGWVARGMFNQAVPVAANDDRLGPPPTLPAAIARAWKPVRPSWAMG